MRKLGAYALIIILTAGVLLGFGKWNNNESSKDHPIEDAGEQWAQLRAIGNEFVQGTIRATVKWQGEWNTLLSPEEAAGVLSSRLGLSSPKFDTVQDHDQYHATGDMNGVHSKLSVTIQEKGQLYVVLRMEAEGTEGMDALNNLQYNYGNSLLDEGVVVQWNAALQGTSSTVNAGDISGPQESATQGEMLQQIEEQVSSTIQPLHLVESYEDVNTLSRSYEVPGLPLAVMSGDHKIALQVALHQNSDTGLQEISVGSPLLTIEY
ncbi:YwmB family TATA-box binding protein [Paenibacillus segetis]|uniref:TATA-box binding n=1 Tax=Paenibacillus segetis TaxID=1325360 RepID=A0ABQ1YS02_9BACL|nr:YwmB family TATA-box binding protein [Paenibacillus segetis]GGH34909.1 hypothetical protein GCM10008013_40910 [Paenibacillus segetis]